jgi:hypothetical protein
VTSTGRLGISVPHLAAAVVLLLIAVAGAQLVPAPAAPRTPANPGFEEGPGPCEYYDDDREVNISV